MTLSYTELVEAKKVLQLPDRASMQEIKLSYKSLLKRWHPDTCIADMEKCNEMTARIVAAYKTVRLYCDSYEYSFEEQELKLHLSKEEWWMDKFGEDPLWGRGKK